MKKISIILSTLSICTLCSYSLKAMIPVVDAGTQSLITAQTTNDIMAGIDRAQEALRAYSQSIKLYESAIDRFNKLQDLYKNNIEQNRLIDTIKGYKGDPRELIGMLSKTKRAVRKYSYYGNRYYQNPEDIVTDQKEWKRFESAYGKVDDLTYRFTGDNAKQHYENLQEMTTAYYEYNNLIKENIKKKQELHKELERLQDEYDKADTENKRFACSQGISVVKQALKDLQDQEDVAYKNLQALIDREKIFGKVRQYLEDNNYAYQEKQNRETSEYMTNEDAYESIREAEDQALARNNINLW